MGAARPDSPNLRTRRSALNFVSGVLFSAVTLVVGFIATPLLLRWLGDERYGAFRAAGDWLSQLTILELGFAGALAPLLALALGRGDDSGVLGTLGEGIRASCAWRPPRWEPACCWRSPSVAGSVRMTSWATPVGGAQRRRVSRSTAPLPRARRAAARRRQPRAAAQGLVTADSPCTWPERRRDHGQFAAPLAGQGSSAS
jgi:hypothetical protein